MAPVIRTHAQVARWIGIQTAFATILVLPATAGAWLWLFGADLSYAISGWEAMRFGLVLTLAETLLFTPLVAIRSVGTLRQLNLVREELDRLAGADPLTDLLNRRGFEKTAAILAAELSARGGSAAAVVCDLDGLKQINDAFGHDFGDEALRHFANVLRNVAGDRGFALGRRGGDEFVVLMTCVAREKAVAFADELRATMTTSPRGSERPECRAQRQHRRRGDATLGRKRRTTGQRGRCGALSSKALRTELRRGRRPAGAYGGMSRARSGLVITFDRPASIHRPSIAMALITLVNGKP